MKAIQVIVFCQEETVFTNTAKTPGRHVSRLPNAYLNQDRQLS